VTVWVEVDVLLARPVCDPVGEEPGGQSHSSGEGPPGGGVLGKGRVSSPAASSEQPSRRLDPLPPETLRKALFGEGVDQGFMQG